jgi:hypothetical protein
MRNSDFADVGFMTLKSRLAKTGLGRMKVRASCGHPPTTALDCTERGQDQAQLPLPPEITCEGSYQRTFIR